MAGVKQFDRDEVLDLAAEVFWREGFEATSIQDLEMATGLGRGSLYNAFGDKAALFQAVLARYGDRHGAPPLRHLEASDVFEGVGRMLREIACAMDAPGRPRGCLMTNTCLQAGGGTALDAQIATAIRSMEQVFGAAFLRAQAEGQLAPGTDTRALARFYCGVVQSLGVMHKALGCRRTLADIIDIALQAWPARRGIDAD